jgi:hypothetical protein
VFQVGTNFFSWASSDTTNRRPISEVAPDFSLGNCGGVGSPGRKYGLELMRFEMFSV